MPSSAAKPPTGPISFFAHLSERATVTTQAAEQEQKSCTAPPRIHSVPPQSNAVAYGSPFGSREEPDVPHPARGESPTAQIDRPRFEYLVSRHEVHLGVIGD